MLWQHFIRLRQSSILKKYHGMWLKHLFTLVSSLVVMCFNFVKGRVCKDNNQTNADPTGVNFALVSSVTLPLLGSFGKPNPAELVVGDLHKCCV